MNSYTATMLGAATSQNATVKSSLQTWIASAVGAGDGWYGTMAGALTSNDLANSAAERSWTETTDAAYAALRRDESVATCAAITSYVTAADAYTQSNLSQLVGALADRRSAAQSRLASIIAAQVAMVTSNASAANVHYTARHQTAYDATMAAADERRDRASTVLSAVANASVAAVQASVDAGVLMWTTQ